MDEALGVTARRRESRARETPRQWQGRYDMTMGRFLAMKIRYYEYNWACARMKKAPPKFTNPRSNAWMLVPADVLPTSKKAAAAWLKAKSQLKRVVDEHSGTEWALQAQRELNHPCGFKWVETYVQPIAIETQAAAQERRNALLDLATQLAQDKEWDKARDALARAGELTPRTVEASKLLHQRGDVYAMLGFWDRAAADYGEVLRLRQEDPSIRYHQILALLAAGDRDAAWHAGSELLNRSYKTTEPLTANSVAWSSVLTAGAATDFAVSVRLAEFAMKDYPATLKGAILNTLGAALYRAGRFEDAVRRLDEGIQLRNRESLPADWPFLAMAHFRLGHRDEARRWLDQLRDRQPSTDPNRFWDELEIRILRSEAEAVVLYDPVFPADPFVH